METNTRYISFRGKFETSKQLELGQDIDFSFWVGEEQIEGKAEVVQIQNRSNQDGTFDAVFICKPNA